MRAIIPTATGPVNIGSSCDASRRQLGRRVREGGTRAMSSATLPEIAPTAGDTTWFTHDRFGLFIHWGIYSAAARHEWVKQRERISDADYQPYFDHFDPDLYDPRQWARD